MILVVVDSYYQAPENVMSSFLFVPSPPRLYTAGNLMSLWALERERAGSHIHT